MLKKQRKAGASKAPFSLDADTGERIRSFLRRGEEKLAKHLGTDHAGRDHPIQVLMSKYGIVLIDNRSGSVGTTVTIARTNFNSIIRDIGTPCLCRGPGIRNQICISPSGVTLGCNMQNRPEFIYSTVRS